jgi:hypothetical protein
VSASTEPPQDGFEKLNDLLHKAGVEVAEISTPNNQRECDRLFTLLNECVDIVGKLHDQVAAQSLSSPPKDKR